MAGASSITGYSIYTAFSNYGGYAGQSSTTSGVGGVGAYHHHHRGRAARAQTGDSQKTPPFSQTSDLVDILSGTDDHAAFATATPPRGVDQSGLTGNSSSTLASWLANSRSPGRTPGVPGQFLDTLA